MRPNAQSLLLALGLAGLLGLAFLRGGDEPDSSPDTECTCALELERNGWCEGHSLGYVAGKELRSRPLYDAIDAHGHDVDVATIGCAACEAAAADDGFCEEHLRGFVDGRAYLTRLGWYLARDEPERVEDELLVVDEALRTAERCELCAVALVLRGVCHTHRLTYESGEARPLAPPSGAGRPGAPQDPGPDQPQRDAERAEPRQ